MKAWHKKIHVIAMLLLFLGAGAALQIGQTEHVRAASGPSLSLVASPSSVANGGTVTVTLYVNANGTSIDTVDATVGYSSSLSLQGSASCASSPFAPFPSCPSSGTHVSSSDLGGSVSDSANHQIATYTFKATAGTGTASLTVSGSTASGGNAVPTSTSGTSVSLVTPACPAGYSGTYPSCVAPTSPSTGSGTTTTTSPPKTTTTTPPTSSTKTPTTTTTGGSSGTGSSGGAAAPTTTSSTPAAGATATSSVTDDNGVTIGDKKVEFTNAALAITTKTPSQVSIVYGLSPTALTNSTQPDALGTTHSVTLDPKLLVPGQTYYYSVVTTNAQGTTQTKVESFTTKGLTVAVGVFDKNHQPLKHKTVTLHSTPTTATTDNKGYAVFSNVAPGEHHVVYAADKQQYTQPVQVINNVVTTATTQSSATQNFSVVYGLSQHSNKAALQVSLAVLIIAALGIGVFFVLRRRVSTSSVPAGPPLTAAPTVVAAQQATSAPVPPAQEIAVAATPALPINQPSTPVVSSVDTLDTPTTPLPGSMVAPKDDALSDQSADQRPGSGV